MRLRYKPIVVCIILFGLMQLYRPAKNLQSAVNKNDFLLAEKAPSEIALLYKKACYDCHSNNTNYSWFDNIAPLSWYVDNNIKKGVFSLNFSEWKNLTPIDKEIMFSAIPFDIMTDKMPPQKYRMLHPKAELSNNDKTKMIKWLTEVKLHFLRKEGE
ncbi:hypothetical protein GWK08_04065 [Leptobacterium flavescens]|uniref:Haem-binding domain-containing protein n=1 Tax=Leptobacterium flavescens TaxID=472055 RepID=A0A6P0UNN5_9FLAO|nr:heme-binding domain-containing protein [Leptobacterium flavescens]NER12603.1 hypothetical protein [Leptobacterium flavescens]